jgi:ribosomal protein L13
MNRQMNQMSGRHSPSFTPKQGQYLAFIDATRVCIGGRPPKPTSSGTSA